MLQIRETGPAKRFHKTLCALASLGKQTNPPTFYLILFIVGFLLETRKITSTNQKCVSKDSIPSDFLDQLLATDRCATLLANRAGSKVGKGPPEMFSV